MLGPNSEPLIRAARVESPRRSASAPPLTREQQCAELLQMQAEAARLLSQPLLQQAEERAAQGSVGTPAHDTQPPAPVSDESESDFEDDSEDDAASWPSASRQVSQDDAASWPSASRQVSQGPLSFFQPQSPVDAVVDIEAFRARIMDEVHSVLHAVQLQYPAATPERPAGQAPAFPGI